MPAFAALELWSNLACASGSRLGYLPATAATIEERFEGHVVVPRLSVTLPRDWSGTSDLEVMKIVRVAYSDATFDEFRISTIQDSGQSGLLSLQADGIILDLAVRNTVVTSTSSPVVTMAVVKTDTVTNCLTTALTAGPSYVAVGTVTPTTTVEVSLNRANPLAAAIAIAEAELAATGTFYELSARRNGTTDYKLDLTVYNSSATAPELRTGRNLLVLKRTRSTRDLATRVIPIGTDGLGVQDNWWKVDAVSLNTYIDVVDINGTGLGPAQEADALNTAWYVIDDANGSHQITDTVVLSSTKTRLYMSSTSGIAANEWVRLAANSSKDETTYVETPAGQATYGLRTVQVAGRVPGVTNRLRNPDFSGGATSDWFQLGTGYTEDTTTWSRGGRAYKNKAVGATVYQQIASGNSYFDRTGPFTMGWRYRVAAVPGSGSVSLAADNPQTGANSVLQTIDNTYAGALGTWLDVAVTFNITSVGAKAVTIYADVNSATANSVYIDSAFAGYGTAVNWVRGSGGAQLWQAGLAYLADNASPTLTYEAQVVDLERLDGTTWPYDTLTHGGSATVVDSDLGITTSQRVVSLRRNLLRPTETTVTLASQPNRLTSLLL